MNTFEITTAGNAAATVAETSGPKISIKTFKVGSSLTAVSTSHTNIQGSLVYQGNCSYFSRYSSDTAQVICEIPANVGPVNFGEIGLFLEDGTMYARMAYSTLQFKASAAANGYGEVVRVHALLRLTQNPAIFNFYTGDPHEVGDVPNFTYLVAPSVDGNTPAYVVHESTPDGESMFVYKNTANLWTVSGYRSVGALTVTASFPNTLSGALFTTLGNTSIAGKYVIQTSAGQLRKVNSITSGTATLNFAMAPVPAIGSTVQVLKYMSDASSLLELADASSVIGPDSMSPAVNEVLVHEPTSTSFPIHLVRQSASQWNPHGYYFVSSLTPSAVSTPSTKTLVTSTVFGAVPRPSVGNQYILQDATTGRVIAVESLSGNVATLVRAAPWITTSSVLKVFRPLQERIDDPYTLDSLTDVDTSTNVVGDVLTWNGTNWVPGGGVPVGTILTGLWLSAPTGYLGLGGQILNRADYPRLWSHVQDLAAIRPDILVLDGLWSEVPGVSSFSYGNGTTTFRLPNYGGSHAKFLQTSVYGHDYGEELGEWLPDSVKAHTHSGVLRSPVDGNQHNVTNYRDTEADLDNATGSNLSYVTDSTGTADNRVRAVVLYGAIKY